MNNVEKDIVIDYTENNLSLEFLYRRYRCPKIEIVEILQRNNIKIKDYFILEKEVLKDLYIEQNKTITDIANYYKQPVRNIKRLLVYYNIDKSPEEVKQARLEKIKSSNLEKYGVEYPYQSKKIREKSTLTTLSRYGVDNPFQLEEFKEKIKKTTLDKYGVVYNTQREEVKKKLSDYIKNNPKLHNRKDITDYGKKYIDNFEMYLNSIIENGELTISTKEISIMFGVAENTIINKIKKYNSNLIKAKSISSWEEPIKNLLEKNNIKYNGNNPILISGKKIKSINQYYNKMTSKQESLLPNNIFTSKSLDRLWLKRNSKISYEIHKVTKFLANYFDERDVSKVIIGYNSGWKNGINLGKRTNQNFVNIPYTKFINQLTYKCQILGITVITREESYTSKASFLDYDEIPNYKDETKPKFSGRRIKRGLYKSTTRKINADVNGAYNIMAKENPNYIIGKREQLGFNPILIKL